MSADVRSALVLDTRELDRRAGSEKRIASTLPAPAGLGIPGIGVPEGAPLTLDLSVDSVVEGFWVAGTATAGAVGECVRCLDPVHQDVLAEVGALYVHAGPGRDARADDEGATESSEDVFALDGDHLDLEQAVRDAVVLALPLLPVCRPDCPGLLLDGSRVPEGSGRPEPVDPRWAALAALAQPRG